MMRHIVLVKFKPAATEDQRAAWYAAVRGLCDGAPEVQSYTLGTNVGSGPNHHDAALVADFADMAAFRRYVDGPAHKDYVQTHAIPVVDTLAAIQHTF